MLDLGLSKYLGNTVKELQHLQVALLDDGCCRTSYIMQGLADLLQHADQGAYFGSHKEHVCRQKLSLSLYLTLTLSCNPLSPSQTGYNSSFHALHLLQQALQCARAAHLFENLHRPTPQDSTWDAHYSAPLSCTCTQCPNMSCMGEQ